MTAPVPLSERLEALHCIDCGDSEDWYMVRDDVWIAAGMGLAEDDGCLCIGCLEARLGYELCAADFTPWPINDPGDPYFDSSPWHVDRLARPATNEPKGSDA